ncbi:hypothetical protein PR048_009215 [Dryococelus australis]|uniref:Uncharacterized protein n=1 Tax=Dryococelus australis TaxID=614101 RepID=A0ABQ9HZC0_9NEOP|nr:hypothetical protein PR048_009215 [Dryococelus australis]
MIENVQEEIEADSVTALVPEATAITDLIELKNSPLLAQFGIAWRRDFGPRHGLIWSRSWHPGVLGSRRMPLTSLSASAYRPLTVYYKPVKEAGRAWKLSSTPTSTFRRCGDASVKLMEVEEEMYEVIERRRLEWYSHVRITYRGMGRCRQEKQRTTHRYLAPGSKIESCTRTKEDKCFCAVEVPTLMPRISTQDRRLVAKRSSVLWRQGRPETKDQTWEVLLVAAAERRVRQLHPRGKVVIKVLVVAHRVVFLGSIHHLRQRTITLYSGQGCADLFHGVVHLRSVRAASKPLVTSWHLQHLQLAIMQRTPGCLQAGETGDPRENPLSSVIVRYDYNLRKSGSEPAATPLTLVCEFDGSCFTDRQNVVASAALARISSQRATTGHTTNKLIRRHAARALRGVEGRRQLKISTTPPHLSSDSDTSDFSLLNIGERGPELGAGRDCPLRRRHYESLVGRAGTTWSMVGTLQKLGVSMEPNRVLPGLTNSRER